MSRGFDICFVRFVPEADVVVSFRCSFERHAQAAMRFVYFLTQRKALKTPVGNSTTKATNGSLRKFAMKDCRQGKRVFSSACFR